MTREIAGELEATYAEKRRVAVERLRTFASA